MSLTMFDPWTELESLRDEVERRFAAAGGAAVRPALAVDEEDGAFRLEMDMPGVTPGDIDLQVEGRTVRVTAERSSGTQRCRYERRLSLPDDADLDGIDANLLDGVLRVRVPKREQAAPRRIAVGTAPATAIQSGRMRRS